MQTVRGRTDRDLGKLDGIIARGERLFKERQPRSLASIGGATSGSQPPRALRR